MFLEEVPKILRKFKLTIVFCFIVTAGMVVLSGAGPVKSVYPGTSQVCIPGASQVCVPGTSQGPGRRTKAGTGNIRSMRSPSGAPNCDSDKSPKPGLGRPISISE
jgi:hypothetical protein